MHAVRRATAADAEAIAAVHVAAWQETYADILDAAVIARHGLVKRVAYWRGYIGTAGDLATFVAELDGQVVGFANGCRVREPTLVATGVAGEIATVYLLQRAQRRGLGGWLLRAVATALLGAGLESGGLLVLAGNRPARAFYAALGGIEGPEQDADISGQVVPELAVTWPDLRTLAAAQSATGV